ncbi:hypothetical protein DP73_10765 [Desulfosporosinus sp. HMP52]|uniref:hypothetical protein n=1 Tax=Desulfosporosinus sp. HMP52 TaxID=1487923 RepID=UPI00051FC815|nr:hypothetical protein [Desulfosporosinus sp. HMP52]KGK89275.1 hypothetical protein DP73_10765 [Desulfosporosinus sp. HMP52]
MKELKQEVGNFSWKLCLDELTSFSVKPLQLANYAGVILITFGFSYLLAMLLLKVFSAVVICGAGSKGKVEYTSFSEAESSGAHPLVEVGL